MGIDVKENPVPDTITRHVKLAADRPDGAGMICEAITAGHCRGLHQAAFALVEWSRPWR